MSSLWICRCRFLLSFFPLLSWCVSDVQTLCLSSGLFFFCSLLLYVVDGFSVRDFCSIEFTIKGGGDNKRGSGAYNTGHSEFFLLRCWKLSGRVLIFLSHVASMVWLANPTTTGEKSYAHVRLLSAPAHRCRSYRHPLPRRSGKESRLS